MENDTSSKIRDDKEAGKERQRRVEALQHLAVAQTSADSPAARQPQSQQASGAPRGIRRRWAAASVALTLVLIVGVVSAYVVTRRHSPIVTHLTIPLVRTLDMTSLGFSCPAAMAWSPDGGRLAVLAHRGDCTAHSGLLPPDTVLLYTDGTSTAPTTIDLSGPLAVAHATIDTTYAVSWSPDGKMVALPCDIQPAPASTRTFTSGLVLVTVTGGAVRVLQATVPSSNPPVGFDGDGAVWNTRSATLASAIDYPLAPSLSYQITADGHITAEQRLPATTTAYTGSPALKAGDHTFSLWQSGFIARVRQVIPNAGPTGPAAAFYVSAAPQWSSDGAYVAPAVGLGSIPFPDEADALRNLTPDTCANLGLPPCSAVVAPYPDAALKQMVNQVTAFTDFHTDPRFPVAWRPDGKLLATILPGDTFNQDTQKVRISLLRTDTGEVAKTFTITTSSSGAARGAEATLAWSPAGQQLAFMDTFSGTVTLWSSANLNY
ncbi:MAG TPA: hypothetical protein VJN88_09685 [Ktedonobacterales bacterium]|nr:hypothetical protein [Ktedonobacterales bacterium]